MANLLEFEGMIAEIAELPRIHSVGRVCAVESGAIRVAGLSQSACLGDTLSVKRTNNSALYGEVVQICEDTVVMLPDGAQDGVSLNDSVRLRERTSIAPCERWIGRIIDPVGQPLDGRPLARGPLKMALLRSPPPAAERHHLGTRLNTGLCALNTLLPIAVGQRVGLFAGSGVGKSSLLAQLAKNVNADIIVIAMIGERGREVREFVDKTLGQEGLKRSVVVAATSDQSPLLRRRCAWTAMTVAEYFRDQGHSVLLLADSITRFAEAHREVAIAGGEAPVLRGFPPSTTQQIMSLCERAGPGYNSQGNITAIFTVLVAGSDMEEPISDILRGTLDGHIILSRTIAERGRYPAIDLSQSVSRSLPEVANDKQNKLIALARKYQGLYDANAAMINAGLYSAGSNDDIDKAIELWPELDNYLSKLELGDIEQSFTQLELIFRRANIVI